MKFNKEMLLKHKFWVLLLVTVPLSLGALFLLVTSVSGDITRVRTSLEAEQKRLKPSGQIRTPGDIAVVRREAEIEKAKLKVVHSKAYAEQDALFFWPDQVENEFHFRSGLFAQQIKIKRGPGRGEMPKDEERLIHGVVTNRGDGFIEVESRDKQKHKFLMSMNVVAKNAVEGDDKGPKEVEFAGIQKGDQVAVAFHHGKYFAEPLTDRELQIYTGSNVYLSQIDRLLTQVEPMTAKGEGVVQLRTTGGTNWYYKKGDLPPSRDDQRFLVYLNEGWKDATGEISEEAWIAQEDLWVQSEIYRLIRMANDNVSKFKGTGGDAKNKTYTFTNPFWELAITWPGGPKLNVKIKNRQDRRQKLDDLAFRVRFSHTMDPETIAVGGPPLGPQEVRELPITLNGDNPGRKGIFGVEQVLTWETAAVRRIDAISIGSLQSNEIAMCNRTYSDPQQSLKNDEWKQGDVLGRAKKLERGGRGGRGAKKVVTIAEAANQITKHGLIRNRYMEVNPQVSRRIPVAVALIVDQDHIDRVEAAFNNSKLRFLTTQLSLNRYPGSLRPVLPVETTTSGLINPREVRPTRQPENEQPSSGSSDEMENNIEMVIYGVVTLYERYPPPLFPPTGPGTTLTK